MDGGVGARLREARLQRGIDLAEVEASTKIRARFLGAIEDEEWDRLPSAFSARAFLHTYADHLGLDGARMVEELDYDAVPGPAADRGARIDPAPPQEAQFARRHRLSPRLLATIAGLGLAAVLVAVGLASLGGDSNGPSPARRSGGGDRQQLAPGPSGPAATAGKGATLTLTATAEVWVCLLDEQGRALIDGQILGPGSEAGPYRSASFMISLGNGAVTMSVAGRPASIPPTPNPIGFSIDRHGALRELAEAERPTCT
jgi:cytoskeleton protein RodZ